jgi:hypothetical protein
MNKYNHRFLALAVLLSACGASDPSPGNNTANAVTQNVAEPVAIGAAGKREGLEFTVTKVETTSLIGPAGIGTTASDGETFVVASYTIKNTADKPLSFLERPRPTLVDGNGQSYSPDEMATGMTAATMTHPSGMASDLNPNVSAKGKMAWKVDKEAFDKGKWQLVLAGDPPLTFALK